MKALRQLAITMVIIGGGVVLQLAQAQQSTRLELARLVRRVHGGGAVRRRAADLSDSPASR
jgi:hypothetical protein